MGRTGSGWPWYEDFNSVGLHFSVGSREGGFILGGFNLFVERGDLIHGIGALSVRV